jgi:hypothetical protein
VCSPSDGLSVTTQQLSAGALTRAPGPHRSSAALLSGHIPARFKATRIAALATTPVPRTPPAHFAPRGGACVFSVGKFKDCAVLRRRGANNPQPLKLRRHLRVLCAVERAHGRQRPRGMDILVVVHGSAAGTLGPVAEGEPVHVALAVRRNVCAWCDARRVAEIRPKPRTDRSRHGLENWPLQEPQSRPTSHHEPPCRSLRAGGGRAREAVAHSMMAPSRTAADQPR